MKKLKALITAEFTQDGLDALGKYMDIEYHNWFIEKRGPFSNEEMIQMGADKDVIIVEITPVPREVLIACPSLKLMGCCRGLRGDDPSMDVAYCTEHNIPVLLAPGRNMNSVAEMTVFLTMGILRKYQPVARWFQEGGWVRPHEFVYTWRTREIKGKTVGLVGFGNIGRSVSALFNALGAHVLAYDPYVNDPEVYAKMNVEKVDLPTLLGTADIISLHMNVSNETKGMIGAKEFAMMKPDAVLVNSARAVLVNRGALYQSLENHTIGGYATDVFHNEPANPDNEPLANYDNVFFMPHIGGTSSDIAANHTKIITDDVERIFNHETPKFVTNSTTLEKFWEGMDNELS